LAVAPHSSNDDFRLGSVKIAVRIRPAVATWLVACLAIPAAAGADSTALLAKYRQLSENLRAATGSWQPTPPITGSLLFIAPDQYSLASMAKEPSKSTQEARREYANALFNLAKQAADAGQLSLAFQWATETLRNDPDHADARRVLGFEERDGQWLTPYGAKMLEAGKIWDPKRAWIARHGLDSDDSDSKSEAARHANIKNGWHVRTDHFLVTTNHSLASGAELAARLERLYQIWRQLFAGFYYTEKEVRDLFAGDRIARAQARPFRVLYYRDKNEYVEALRRRQPRIAETLGIYFDTFREAHFFAPAASASAESAVATLNHEAVHQLFQESKPSAKRIGSTANFWIIEGVATYFETLTEHNDPQTGLYFTIGERAAGRLPAARDRLRDGFYVPLAELTTLNKDDVQRHPDIAKLYSQSSGLAAFLIDAEAGRYREPLVEYLQLIYAGRDDKESLAAATKTSYEKLDAAYRRHMESLP
jgi:hypothetical protein